MKLLLFYIAAFALIVGYLTLDPTPVTGPHYCAICGGTGTR